MTRPFFSIVIPTYERPKALAGCLEALAGSDYPRESFEVVVVDDGSAAPPLETVQPWTSVLDARLVCQPHAGPAAARNAGASEARGRFLAFTDDDCRPARGWLSAFAAHLDDGADCAHGGATINALPENLYATASQLLISYLYAYYNADPAQAQFFASNNLVFPRALFLSLGGFDPGFPRAAAEDRELCARWRQSGHRLVYEPNAVVYHAHPLTLHSFWRQHWNYGRGAAHLRRVLARRGQGAVKMEPFSFYIGLLRIPFLPERGTRAWEIFVLLFLTQIANAVGFARELARPSEVR